MSEKPKETVEIGVHMPDWLPEAWHFPARIALGTVIGLMILFYAFAMAYTVNRLMWGMKYGGPSDEIAFDIAYLAVMVLAAFVLRHVLKRGRARPVAEM